MTRAALVTLASEGNAPRPTVTGAVARIETARATSTYTSTQENAWLVLAARAIAKDSTGISLNVNGEAKQGVLYQSANADRRSRRRRSRSRITATVRCKRWCP